MSARHARLVVPFLTIAGLLAACDHRTGPSEDDAPMAESAALTFTPIPPITPPSYTPHLWVGKQVKISDLSGYVRCLTPVAAPASGVRLDALSCYAAPFDSIQWFTVEAVGNITDPVYRADPTMVRLRSAYNPSVCVDVAGGTSNGGEVMQLFTCHMGWNQRFHLPKPASARASATGPILSKHSGYGMAIEGDAPGFSPLGRTWHRSYNAAILYQRWRFAVR